MKFLHGYLCFVALIGFFFVTCALYNYKSENPLPVTAPLAVSNEADAQVIVQRLDNEGGYIGIFIDGNYAGKLGNGQTGFYKLTTRGIHKITARYDIEYRQSRKGWEPSLGYIYDFWYRSGKLTDPIEFADFGSFTVKYIGKRQTIQTNERHEEEYLVELAPNNNSISGMSVGRSSSNIAINQTFRTLSGNIPNNARIAIVNVDSNNMNESVYIIDELTVLFVNANHFVVDRNRLQAIMNEQRFQMSGYVDDNSIISIGHFAGASVVLTGNINVVDGRRRLVFRVLDVLTGRILAMSSVDL